MSLVKSSFKCQFCFCIFLKTRSIISANEIHIIFPKQCTHFPLKSIPKQASQESRAITLESSKDPKLIRRDSPSELSTTTRNTKLRRIAQNLWPTLPHLITKKKKKKKEEPPSLSHTARFYLALKCSFFFFFLADASFFTPNWAFHGVGARDIIIVIAIQSCEDEPRTMAQLAPLSLWPLSKYVDVAAAGLAVGLFFAWLDIFFCFVVVLYCFCCCFLGCYPVVSLGTRRYSVMYSVL